MSTPLQCCICGCELSDESFVASHIEGGEHPRSSARLDMKSAMWLWRSNAYYEDTEWMFCPDKSCVEEWKNGSEVKHKLNSYIIVCSVVFFFCYFLHYSIVVNLFNYNNENRQSASRLLTPA